MYDSLKYCLCSDLVMHLSFFPRLFHLQPHIYLPELNFSVFFIENTVPQNLNTIIIVNVLLPTNWKLNFYALMDKRNLHPALCYFICMYCPKLVIHSHQIKLPMASSVDYIISYISLPFSKVLYKNVKCQKYSYEILP